MLLRDILHNILCIDEDSVIFAKRPWTLDSEAEIGKFDPGSRIPTSFTDRGFAYFLEVYLAKEFLEDLGNTLSAEEERLARLIYYAENDA